MRRAHAVMRQISMVPDRRMITTDLRTAATKFNLDRSGLAAGALSSAVQRLTSDPAECAAVTRVLLETARQERIRRVTPGAPHATARAMDRLIVNGRTPAEVRDALLHQQVDLVLTAHPTQATVPAILRATRSIADDATMVQDRMRIDTIARTRPTPIDEVRYGLSVVEETLWHAVTDHLRSIDTALGGIGQPPLPPDVSCIRVGSWIGGDRDGNPNVTAHTTQEAHLMSRRLAFKLFSRDLRALAGCIGNTRASPELTRLARSFGSMAQDCPYAHILARLLDDLEAARDRLDMNSGDIYKTSMLFGPLLAVRDSLAWAGNRRADDLALDTLRRLSCFGMNLMRLDIRQDAARHTTALRAICNYIGAGDYGEWTEPARVSFLTAALARPGPLLACLDRFLDETDCETTREVLMTLRLVSRLDAESLGAYIISMATTPCDILAVQLLQKECGVATPMRVVPLFETLADLRTAAETMNRTLSDPTYRQIVREEHGDRIEVMLGYSDSTKDAGRFASAHALHDAQTRLSAVARKHQVQLTYFHGRGGTISRGGGSVSDIIKTQPPGSVAGAMRVTVQGETIDHWLGDVLRAKGTLDGFTGATLEHTLAAGPPSAGDPVCTDLSRLACEAFRGFVYARPEFIRLFHQSTPVHELGRYLHIGSRPPRRASGGDLSGLRAIPWVFGWAQANLRLTAWLGMGRALHEMVNRGHLHDLMYLYRHWPFFTETMDAIMTEASRADVDLYRWSVDRLVDDAELVKLSEDILEDLSLLLRYGPQITATPARVTRSDDQVLFHTIQVELLKRHRSEATTHPALTDALVMTMQGSSVVSGNTG